MDKREQELKEIIKATGKDNDIKAAKLIDEVVFLEDRLAELRRLPFIKVDPTNPMRQKATPASKQYKEMLQQYNNSLRLLFRIAGDLGESESESPLRKWLKEREGNA